MTIQTSCGATRLRATIIVRVPPWMLLTMILVEAFVASAADPFAENVRTTPWLAPTEAEGRFSVPKGFHVSLFAAEPDILKPMNMAFDGKGRMWVSMSKEYPYAAPFDRPGQDMIKILEDTDDDGRADVITTFADDLNIPIGLYPYGNGVIAWSIPNIWFLEDTNGDGRADRRHVLFGPLGFERDTHGMNASFRRGFDGWIYATHGFNNVSTFRASDGSAITLQSGNTYRFRPDGSRVEQHTWGQVNPFGLCWDPLGQLYSADCHSAPIYQLLEGGYYPSFGKPHDGLGYAPVMLEHSHGSTAICGVTVYADNLWPDEFRGDLFIGNVMTSRVNRDRLVPYGATPQAREMDDFIKTDDPWFRPVDIQLGPDGALYVADFYNRIIGHYEVPLNHAGRDRTSGRIWRVVFRDENGTPGVRGRRDLSDATARQLVEAWRDPNLTYQLLALNALVDRLGNSAIPAVRGLWWDETSVPEQRILGLWALRRLEALTPDIVGSAVSDSERAVRVHAMRVLASVTPWEESHRQWALKGLKDEDAVVRRSAAEALAAHPDMTHVRPLLVFRQGVDSKDTHLLYIARKSLRDHLREEVIMQHLVQAALDANDADLVADVALALPHATSASFLLGYVQERKLPHAKVAEYARHAARYLPAERMDDLAALISREFPGQIDWQLRLLLPAIREGLAQRGVPWEGAIKLWAENLAMEVLRSSAHASTQWVYRPLPGAKDLTNPWAVQRRESTDGVTEQSFFCTLPSGEQRTGVLRSPRIRVPKRFSFFIAGHDGFPDKPAKEQNYVQMLDAETGAVLVRLRPPRHDVAQPATWDLSRAVGREAYLELVDQDAAGAYAWLAVGRFDPPILNVPDADPVTMAERQRLAVELAAELRLIDLGPDIQRLFRDLATDPRVRMAAASSIAILNPSGSTDDLIAVLKSIEELKPLREKAAESLASLESEEAMDAIMSCLTVAPRDLQVRLAGVLAGRRVGSERLLQAIEAGQAPPLVLLDRSVRDKLLAASPEDVASRLAKLTDSLAEPEQERDRLLASKLESFAPERASAGKGRGVFDRTCAACHQVGRQGGLVGPQLDGIGNRGLERVLEDILDPNRNVDQAFRSTVFVMKDGDIVTGLFRREEGELVVLADATGKEVSLDRQGIQSRVPSDTSLMPDNFAEVLSAEEFDHLVAFLMAQRAEQRSGEATQ